MDTKFSVALHILVMISERGGDLSSQALATSVGTNASYIRKITALLKKAGLLASQQGKSGYQLVKLPKDLSLLEVYYATQEVDHFTLFQVHQHANPACPVGKHAKGVMSAIFGTAEQEVADKLTHQTLQDVIDELYHQVKISQV